MLIMVKHTAPIAMTPNVKGIPAVGELKAQKMKLELNFYNSTNAESSTSDPIAGYAVLPAVHSRPKDRKSVV